MSNIKTYFVCPNCKETEEKAHSETCKKCGKTFCFLCVNEYGLCDDCEAAVDYAEMLLYDI